MYNYNIIYIYLLPIYLSFYLSIYLSNSQKSTSDLGPVMKIIANLGRSHRLPLTVCFFQKTNVRPSIQSPIQYICIVLPVPGIAAGVVAVLK